MKPWELNYSGNMHYIISEMMNFLREIKGPKRKMIITKQIREI